MSEAQKQSFGRAGVFGMLLLAIFLTACSSASRQTPEQRAESAKVLFGLTTTNYHEPSATAKNGEKTSLLKKAAAGYEELLKKYPEQDYWAAQAMRNLAGVRAEQGQVEEAVKLYSALETKYPKQDWEILMAWKGAGDLLWDAGKKDAAKGYYKKIVDKYNKPDFQQVIQIVVRASKRRLAGTD
jgi:predicted negative regulator of RcsB-dependent stress response